MTTRATQRYKALMAKAHEMGLAGAVHRVVPGVEATYCLGRRECIVWFFHLGGMEARYRHQDGVYLHSRQRTDGSWWFYARDPTAATSDVDEHAEEFANISNWDEALLHVLWILKAMDAEHRLAAAQ